MKARRTIYFLAHGLLVTLGTIISFWGYDLKDPWKSLLIAIGTSVIATGAAGMLIWVYLSHVEVSSARLEMLAKVGLDRVYDKRAAQIRDEYAQRLKNANSHIDILGFGLKDFRRDYIKELGAMSAHAKVRILLIDPDSSYCGQRDLEEGQSQGTIKSEVNEFITQFKQLYPYPSQQLELRLFNCLPLINVFRIDNDLFWGPYLVGMASGNTMTLRASRSGSMFEQLLEHFETVWENYSKKVR